MNAKKSNQVVGNTPNWMMELLKIAARTVGRPYPDGRTPRPLPYPEDVYDVARMIYRQYQQHHGPGSVHTGQKSDKKAVNQKKIRFTRKK